MFLKLLSQVQIRTEHTTSTSCKGQEHKGTEGQRGARALSSGACIQEARPAAARAEGASSGQRGQWFGIWRGCCAGSPTCSLRVSVGEVSTRGSVLCPVLQLLNTPGIPM